MTEEITEPLIRMTKDGIRVISEETSKELARKKLSASTVNGLQGCTASWLANSFVLPKILVDDSLDNAARRGSLFHQVMENYFALPAEKRTKKAMVAMVDSVLNEPTDDYDYTDLADNRDVVLWLRGAVNGYYNMGADTDPADVVIAEIESTHRDGTKEIKKGLEIFVMGQIGEAKRPTLGFIDRLKEIERIEGSPVSTVVGVEDWKTGAKVKRYNPKSRAKHPEGLAEQRQQIIYAMLLEQQYGVEVGEARLIFPVAREVVTVDLSDEKLRARVIEDVENADAQLTDHIERNLFEYSPGILCSWCPLAKICPAARQFPRVEKAVKAWADQPEPDVLAPAIDFGNKRR